MIFKCEVCKKDFKRRPSAQPRCCSRECSKKNKYKFNTMKCIKCRKNCERTGGSQKYCGACSKDVKAVQHRKWLRAHPESAPKSRRNWARENPEKVRDSNRKWYYPNPDISRKKTREHARKWYYA